MCAHVRRGAGSGEKVFVGSVWLDGKLWYAGAVGDTGKVGGFSKN